MLKFVQIFFTIFYVFGFATAKGPYRWFPLNKQVSRYDKIASCIHSAARRFFSSDYCLIVMSAKYGPLENEIARLSMKEDTMFMASKDVKMRNERLKSYIIVEMANLTNLRNQFLGESRSFFSTSEYLIVLKTNNKITHSFSSDMWRLRFFHFAFIFLEDPEHIKIGLPVLDSNGKLVLEMKDACATNGKKDSFALSLRKLCSFKKCVLRYGGVSDETVFYWREEDKLRVPSIGKKFVEMFGNLYNMSVDTNVSRKLNWSEATRWLTKGKVDIVNGWPRSDLKKSGSLHMLCWYMFRQMVFAGLIEQRNVNTMLQLAMPFHYSVWTCIACLSIFYFTLLYSLKRLWLAGLISDYIRSLQVCQIVFLQSAIHPKKVGLRFILGLWIIFVLYLNVIYEGTFASSLARGYKEVKLNSIKEVRDTNRSIGGPKIMAQFLHTSDDKIMRDLYKRYRIISATNTLNELLYNHTMVVMQGFTVDSVNWLHRANKSLKVYSLPYPVLVSPIVFFSKKGHPYNNLFKENVMRIYETGFWHKWYTISMVDDDKSFAEDPADADILKMTQLSSEFFIYFICISISIFVFVLELFYYNYLGKVRQLTTTTKACNLRGKTLTHRRR